MIALLTGTPIIHNNSLILEVNGVGYAIAVSAGTLQAVQVEAEATLHTHAHIREDTFDLYGFLTLEDKELFLLLQNVSGIGPATALAISDRGASAIIAAVQNADLSFFTGVPRVGKKSAQKIIIELTSKLGSLKELDLAPLPSFKQDVIAALGSLGFTEDDVAEFVREQDFGDSSLQTAVQKTLKSLGSNTTN